MSRDAEPDYSIGYGRPPAATRFKAGRSGNPAGRPKSKSLSADDARRLKTLQEVFNSEAQRVVEVTERGRRIKLTAEQAVLRSLISRAIQGDSRAATQFLKFASLRAPGDASSDIKFFNDMVDYKEGVTKMMTDRNITVLRPEWPIDPGDILLDFRHKSVKVNGPRDAVEREEWGNAEHQIGVLSSRLRETSLPLEREAIEEEIAEILDYYPSPATRRSEIFDLDVWRAGAPRRQRERRAARDAARAAPKPAGVSERQTGRAPDHSGEPQAGAAASKGWVRPAPVKPERAPRVAANRPLPARGALARGPEDRPTRVAPMLTIVSTPGRK